jgi:hypothetical protein
MIFKRRNGTVVEAIREAIVAEVHFAEVGPARHLPTVLRIEGPGALSGAAERAVQGRERELTRAGFRLVECLGVDPGDARGRQGRLRASVPEPGGTWVWERVSGAELQARIIEAAEVNPAPRPVEEPRSAAVLSLGARRKRR